MLRRFYLLGTPKVFRPMADKAILEIKFFFHKAYRFLLFDDCPNWQHLVPHSLFLMRVWFNKKNLPQIAKKDNDIVKNIVSNGVCLTSLDALGFEKTQDFKKLSKKLFEDTEKYFKEPQVHLGGHFTFETHTLRPPLEYILKNYSDVYRFALNARLMSMVQHYIGAPAVLLDVDFKIDLPGGNDSGNKIWHYDKMDYKILKIFIYFTDVGKKTPAFEYINARECLKIKTHRFNESKVYDFTKRENVVRVEAPSESVLFLGVDRILHHLSVPRDCEEKSLRKAVVLHYLSKDVPSQCRECRNGSASRWGSEGSKKLLSDFRETLPEETRKYLYIHDS